MLHANSLLLLTMVLFLPGVIVNGRLQIPGMDPVGRVDPSQLPPFFPSAAGDGANNGALVPKFQTNPPLPFSHPATGGGPLPPFKANIPPENVMGPPSPLSGPPSPVFASDPPSPPSLPATKPKYSPLEGNLEAIMDILNMFKQPITRTPHLPPPPPPPPPPPTALQDVAQQIDQLLQRPRQQHAQLRNKLLLEVLDLMTKRRTMFTRGVRMQSDTWLPLGGSPALQQRSIFSDFQIWIKRENELWQRITILMQPESMLKLIRQAEERFPLKDAAQVQLQLHRQYLVISQLFLNGQWMLKGPLMTMYNNFTLGKDINGQEHNLLSMYLGQLASSKRDEMVEIFARQNLGKRDREVADDAPVDGEPTTAKRPRRKKAMRTRKE